MTVKSGSKITAGYEPIAGYVLEEIIGRGGYGEVWRASSPGGLNKAVKFVYGNRSDERAAQELKSLERIKAIQHPFILSLERFDIVNDRLVIITELAECSLEDLYNEYRGKGSCGIPRKSLLPHIADTADALDYLHQLYKLQHLDIKPANLLMIGGRIKLADFGLLKDLHDVDVSRVGGLTPIYAPPELFDGRPSIHSDQYSLAVMYQELLTGTRPFGGRTIAQLATQHVYNAPNLTPLPPSDRGVVARALEKSPDRRFANCSEFVDALKGGASPSIVTQKVAQDKALQVKDLPEIKSTKKHSQAKGAHRALVVGIGGTGAECVSLLRSRIANLRSLSPLAMHSVVIDTDHRSVYEVHEELESDFLAWHQNLVTPLKTSVQYRDQGTEHLKSLSRRWIYNIPKSGMTEGMRPLGRLALIDHAARVTEVLTEATRSIAAESDDVPSVYVVGSIAGGTGSGMFADVACLLRNLLDENSLHETEILPLLATTRLQGDPKRPLALHNTMAAVEEIRHFCKLENGYPGDEGASWKSVPATRSPLANAYLFAESQVHGSHRPIESIVNYLWADSTFAGQYLADARQVAVEGNTSRANMPTLRSVGVIDLEGNDNDYVEELTNAVVSRLLRHWLGSPKQSARQAEQVFQRIVRRSKLTAAEFHENELLNIGPTPGHRRALLLSKLRTLPAQVLEDEHFSELAIQDLAASLMPETRQDVGEVDAILDKVSKEVLVKLVDRTLDLAAVARIVEVLRLNASRMCSDLEALIEQLGKRSPKLVMRQQLADQQRQSQELDVVDRMRPSESPELKLCCARAQILVEELAARSALEKATELQKRTAVYLEDVSDAAKVLAKSIRTLQPGSLATIASKYSIKTDAILKSAHDTCAHAWLIKLVQSDGANMHEEQLLDNIVRAVSPIVAFHVDEAKKVAEKNATLNAVEEFETDSIQIDLSDSTIRKSTTHVSYRSQSAESLGTVCLDDQALSRDEVEELTLAESIAAVRPALLDCGGLQRLILVASSETELQSLTKEVAAESKAKFAATILKSSTPMLIHEAQQIKTDQVIRLLRAVSGGDERISKKLLTRSDVDWCLEPLQKPNQ